MAYTPMYTRYPELRGVVRPEYESLSDPELANVVAAEVGISADFVENWLSNLGRTVSRIAPGVLSGALQGAVSGAPFGGPFGALAGAVLGGVGGALRAPAAPGAPGVPAGPPAPTPAAQTPGVPAAGALMQLLGNPDTQRALMSMFLGPRLGAPTVNVAGQNVPVAEFANLLREAADQTLTQHDLAGGGAEAGEELPEYLDAERRRGSDTGDPLVRGVVLAKLLDQPTYVPVPTAPPPQTTVVYGQPGTAPVAQPGAPSAPGGPVPPGAPPAVDPFAFEPVPQYGTPDLGISQPIAMQVAERAARQRSERTFQENLESVFELDEAVL
jgi:hypothetical protein